MSTTYRDNSALRKPALDDQLWNVPNDANFDDLDASPMYGGLCVTTAERPSGSLFIACSAGRYRRLDGTWGAYAGGTLALSASQAAVSVYLTDAGVLAASNTGWPAAAHVPLAVAVTGTTTVTGLADARVPLIAAGADLTTIYLSTAGATFKDATGVAVYHTGTTNGVQLGATAAEKLGFWGAAPVIQPSGAAQTTLPSQTQQALTDSSGGTAGLTLPAIAAGAAYAQADMQAVQTAIASLAARLAEVRVDISNSRTLLGAVRAALALCGIFKGGA